MAKSRYDWGDGRKIHTRPKKGPTSKQLNDPAYVTAPKTLRDIMAGSETSANLKYGGQEQALNQQKANIPPWFESYKAQVQGINQGVQQGYAQAVQDVAARTNATQAANDSSRAQQQSSMQADAASRGASVDPSVLANDANAATTRRLGADAQANLLTTQAQGQNAYFGGVQGAAGAAQISTMRDNATQYGQVQADKGTYKAGYVTDATDAERKYALEQAAFSTPTANAQVAADTATANRKSTSANQKAGRVISRKNTRDRLASSERTAGKRLSAQQLKDAEKRKGVTQKSRETSSTALGRLDDINARWHTYRTQDVTPQVDDPNNPGKKIDGKPRKPKPNEVTNRILGETGASGHKFSGSELHLARLLREHKTFSPNDIGIAHRLGIKVPNALRPKKPRKVAPGEWGP